MPAEFVGIENIVKNLNRYKFEGFKVFRGGKTADKKAVIERMADENESEEQLIDVFTEWCEDMLENNPFNYQLYNIQLYSFPENSSRIKGTGSFSFQLISQPANNSIRKKENNEMGSDYVHKDTMLLAIENANLKNQLEALNERLNALESEEDEEEELEDDSIIGTLQTSLKDKMPQIIDFVMGALSNKQQPQYATGIGSNIDEIISEFRTINPNIESDLFKLLQLAKNKPELFSMLINQLRAM